MFSANGANADATSERVARLASNGFVPLPILPGTKACRARGWQHGTIKPSDWVPGCGIGVLGGVGDLTTVDLDHVEHVDTAIIDAINALLPPGCPRSKGRSGPNSFVRAKLEKKASILVGYTVVDDEWVECRVELLTRGQQTVLPPHVHPATGQPYRWVPGPDGAIHPLDDMRIDDVPRFEGNLEAALQKALAPWVVPPTLAKACKAVVAAANGERNSVLNNEVFRLGVSKTGVVYAMAKRWLTLAARHSGLADDEIERTFDSAATAAEAKSSAATAPRVEGLIIADPPKPWASPVDGAELLSGIVAASKRYLSLPPMAAELLTLWGAGTHVMAGAPIFPRLGITSIDAICGKTRVLQFLEGICFRPIVIDDAFPAVIYRLVDAQQPTLLLDECDVWFTQEFRGLANSGHRAGGHVIRCQGDDYTPVAFKTYAPMAYARIGSFGKQFGPLLTRSITLRVSRCLPEEASQLAPFAEKDRDALQAEFGSKLQRWFQGTPLNPAPTLPDNLRLRDADNWRLLFAVAEAAGGDWSSIVQEVAAVFGKPDPRAVNTDKRGAMAAVKQVLAGLPKVVDRIRTTELCERLGELEGFPDAHRYRNLKERQAGWLLRAQFEDFPEIVGPRKIRFGDGPRQGYMLAPFREVFARYDIKTVDELEEEPDPPE